LAIADIDTRKLTRILRTGGAQGGAIVTGKQVDSAEAVELARSFPGMQGLDLAREVSVAEAYGWEQGTCGEPRPHGTSSPTISASSATFCGCWPIAAAG
jgi:carbamoyl-phosphate synthase small subunit